MVELIAEMRRQAEAKCLPEDLDAWEAEAMRKVLGERSDWAPGIGPLIPKRDLFSARRREYDASSSSSTSHEAQGKINELQSVVRSLVDIVTTSMALPSEIAEKLMRFTGEASASQGHSHRSTMHAPIQPSSESTPPTSTTRSTGLERGGTPANGSMEQRTASQARGRGKGCRGGRGRGRP